MATAANVSVNLVLTIADINKEPECHKYAPEVFTFTAKELNAWAREQNIPSQDLLAIKALRRRLKNRFYARDCRARRRYRRHGEINAETNKTVATTDDSL